MASSEGNIVGKLQKHTECSICNTTFTDPRILPCVHTFCLKCLENTASSRNKGPGDEMPCPTCRRVFTVPANGFEGLMRDFKTNSLITMANEANLMSATSVCDRHKTKSLEAYCLECEQPVCISCLIDNHQGHKATDIVEVKERFSRESVHYMNLISSYKEQSLHLMKELDEKKKHYLKEIMENENAILKRSKELIDRIERDTKSLLEELSTLKPKHLGEMEKEREELEKQFAIMENYQTIYEATGTKSSFLDICRVERELPIIVETLIEWFKTRKISSFEDLLQLHDKIEIELKSEINNIVGKFKETMKDEFELRPVKDKIVICVGAGDDGWSVSNEIFGFNLHRPDEISKLQPVPTKMQQSAVVVSFDGNLLLIGIGEDYNEIWKFDGFPGPGWKKCANLDQGRYGHCANINFDRPPLIYIFGGCSSIPEKLQKSVEVYDIQTNKCSAVAELVHAVSDSASVAYYGLIYIFGGCLDGGRVTDCVQIYDTRVNTCFLPSKPMPSPQSSLRALAWNDLAILLNDEICFTFDFQKEIWRKMKQFRTDVHDFGLVHDEEKVYVFGGENIIDKHTDEINCVPLEDIMNDKKVRWKLHGRLPKPTCIWAYASLSL